MDPTDAVRRISLFLLISMGLFGCTNPGGTRDHVPSVSPPDYSLEMAKEWKIGSDNGGLLLLVSIDDRKWRIQIDRKLERSMSNDEVRQIGELMVQEFKEKQYGAGPGAGCLNCHDPSGRGQRSFVGIGLQAQL